MTSSRSSDVLIVGAGPAGLSAAVELRRLGVANVVVIDREAEPGGVPRHCDHTGFGFFDLRAFLSGPAYARERVLLARDAGVIILPETTATAWAGSNRLRTTSPRGISTIAARAILLATGCRERPRTARLVPGSRPLGVLTTGSLQQLVTFQKVRPGRRAVIVGAEHVSFSAVHTLQSSGTEVAAMVTPHSGHQTVPLAAWYLTARQGIPIFTSATLGAIRGSPRVEGVDVVAKDGTPVTTIECDTVVFTGDWIPDHELARLGGVRLCEYTRGPRVDTGLRTNVRGVFAAGNLLRGAGIADVAALEGAFAARSIRNYLSTGEWPETGVAVELSAPLEWVCPSVITVGQLPPRDRFVLRTSDFVHNAHIEVMVGDQVIYGERKAKLVPNRPISLDAAWVRALTHQATSVKMRLRTR